MRRIGGALVRRPTSFVASRNYEAARRIGLLERSVSQRRLPAPLVVVHQMGKVGSTAVHDGIEQACPERRVYHVHHLGHSAIRREEAIYREAFGQRRRIDGHLLDSLHLRRLLDDDELPLGTQVVSIVRDPMAQRLSSFFQTLPFRVQNLDELIRTSDVKILAEQLAEQFMGPGWWHEDRIAQFFRADFGPAWGVDIFADAQFDHERSCLEIPGASCSVMVLRFEDLPASGSRVLAEFLGVAPLHLPPRQVSAEKAYATVMGHVRSSLVFDDDYLGRAYNSDEVRHFYTDGEIESFRSRWQEDSAYS